jgi:hypothetical protein
VDGTRLSAECERRARLAGGHATGWMTPPAPRAASICRNPSHSVALGPELLTDIRHWLDTPPRDSP